MYTLYRLTALCILIIIILLNGRFVFGQKEIVDEDLRDPFIPLIDEKGELRKNFRKPWAEDLTTSISLMGISEINGIYYALLDGELVKEGDVFKDLKIDKIEQDKVILSFGDKRFEIKWETKQK